MEAGIGVGFPAVDIEAKSARAGYVAIHFLDDAGNDFALGLHVSGRSDYETQYANVVRGQRVTPQVNVGALGEVNWASIAAEVRLENTSLGG
jgi:hypothetical protein